jgi:hypothetical protein
LPEDDLFRVMNKVEEPSDDDDEEVYDYENVIVNKLKTPD